MIEVDEKSIKIKIDFANPKALSLYIEEPDILVVKVSLPSMLRDDATGQQIEDESIEGQVLIKP